MPIDLIYASLMAFFSAYFFYRWTIGKSKENMPAVFGVSSGLTFYGMGLVRLSADSCSYVLFFILAHLIFFIGMFPMIIKAVCKKIK